MTTSHRQISDSNSAGLRHNIRFEASHWGRFSWFIVAQNHCHWRTTSNHLGSHEAAMSGNTDECSRSPRLNQRVYIMGVTRLSEFAICLERINCLVAVKSGSTKLRIAWDHIQSHQLSWCTLTLGLCVCVHVCMCVCVCVCVCVCARLREHLWMQPRLWSFFRQKFLSHFQFICQSFFCLFSGRNVKNIDTYSTPHCIIQRASLTVKSDR